MVSKKIPLFLLIAMYSANTQALEVTKEVCTDVLTELGLPTTPYKYKDGWIAKKHIFNGSVECYRKQGSVFVSSAGEVYAERGFFGKDAIAAKNAVLSLHANEKSALKVKLKQQLKEIREANHVLMSELEARTEAQLDKIRQNELPDSIAAVVQSPERKKAEEAKVSTSEKIAELRGEYTSFKAESDATVTAASKSVEARLSNSNTDTAENGVQPNAKSWISYGSYDAKVLSTSPIENPPSRFMSGLVAQCSPSKGRVRIKIQDVFGAEGTVVSYKTDKDSGSFVSKNKVLLASDLDDFKLNNHLVSVMKRGRSIEFTVNGTVLKYSLKGFTKALQALKVCGSRY